jgi:hypothetical protein
VVLHPPSPLRLQQCVRADCHSRRTLPKSKDFPRLHDLASDAAFILNKQITGKEFRGKFEHHLNHANTPRNKPKSRTTTPHRGHTRRPTRTPRGASTAETTATAAKARVEGEKSAPSSTARRRWRRCRRELPTGCQTPFFSTRLDEPCNARGGQQAQNGWQRVEGLPHPEAPPKGGFRPNKFLVPLT